MVKEEDLLEQQVIQFIKEHGLISAGEKLVVAVSGGADSVCMINIMARKQAELGVELHIAHLNHQLRGVESESDARYVSDLALNLGIPSTVECRDVTAYQVERGCSMEEAAREVRYSFLSDVARKTGASKVVVGHTRDDHIETVLMHLLRGTGVAGLRGLQSDSLLQFGEDRAAIRVIRPLLEISRQETLDYCQRYHLKPQTDSSNASLSFLRNRIRLELLPVLKDYNPNIGSAMVRLAAIADNDISFIESQAMQIWNDVAIEEAGTICLNKEKLADIHPSMQRHILRLAVMQLSGNLRDIEVSHIEAMVNFLSKPAGKRLCLPHGLTLYTEYGRLILSSSQETICPLPPLENEYGINVPGETILPGWKIKADILSEEDNHYDSNFVAKFDMGKAGKELAVRQRRPGERFQPLGMSNTKKLQDFLVDSHVPQAWRDRIPLVCSPQQILWVVGYRIDDRARITKATKQILRLAFERLD